MTKMPDHAITPCLVCEPVSEAGFTCSLIQIVLVQFTHIWYKRALKFSIWSIVA